MQKGDCPGSCTTGSTKHIPLLAQVIGFFSRSSHSAHQTSQDCGSSALDVIIKTQVSLFIAILKIKNLLYLVI
jgi:hypothetical protein